MGLTDKERQLLRFCALLKIATTRDKLVKCSQYSIRLYVWLAQRYALTRDRESLERLYAASKFLSKARRVFWLLRWLDSYFDVKEALMEENWADRITGLLEASTDIVSDACDDVCTLEEIGIVKEGTIPEGVERAADRGWFVATLLSLVLGAGSIRRLQRRVADLEASTSLPEKERESGLAKAREGLFLAWISQAKFAADVLPSTHYAFDAPVPRICVTVSSLISGLLSTYKIFYKGPPRIFFEP